MQVLCEKAEQLLILQITVNPTSNLKPFCTISTCSMSSSISCSEEFPVYLRTKSYLISKFLSLPSPVSTCGQSPVKSQPLNYLNIFSRIVGGRQVAKGSYPWQVSSGNLLWWDYELPQLDLSESHATHQYAPFCLVHHQRSHECVQGSKSLLMFVS